MVVTRETLESTFAAHERAVDAAGLGGDWQGFVDLFLPDAVYNDQMVGDMEGINTIKTWVDATLATFPGNQMYFETDWVAYDEEGGRIVASLANVMRDPGDGSVMKQSNISVLTVAEDGRLSGEQDIYDVTTFITLIKEWGRRAIALGTLKPEQIDWYRAAYPDLFEDAGTD